MKKLVFILLFWSGSFVYGVQATWNINASGNWNTNANWSPATYPQNTDDTAIFGNVITNPATVTITAPVTVGSIGIDNSNGYTITGSTITFDVSTGSANLLVTSINGNGAHTISSDISLSDALNILQTSSSPFTISGNISGNQQITLSGTSTLILLGTNTYSGGTIIQSGATLQGNSTSLQGTILDNGALVFNQTVNGTFANVITGSGSLTKSGAALLSLTGANTYSGGTNVTGGTLDGNATSLQGAIVNDATVSFTQTGTGTYSGAMSGSGDLIVQGGGTLILSGLNSYTGGTTVAAGTTLQGTTNSLTGIFTNNGTIVLNQGFNGTTSIDMSGGAFISQGSGTIDFTGTIASTTAAINGGTFLLDGATFIPGTTTIGSGATLAGTSIAPFGQFQTALSVSGTVSPGFGTNGIGRIDLTGSVNFLAGSTFAVDFNNSSTDVFNVTGPADITGATLIPNPLDLSPATHTILTTSALTFPFADVIDPGLLIVADVTYTPTSVLLSIEELPFSAVITSGNAAIVGNFLDAQNLAPGSDLSNVILQIKLFDTIGDIEDALDQLDPSLFNALPLAEENLATRYRAILSERTTDCFYRNWCKGETFCCGCNGWIDVFGDFTKQKSVDDHIGYKTRTGEIAFGLDHSVDRFRMGYSFSYAHSHINWECSRGHGTIETFSGALYGSSYWNCLIVEGAVLGGYNFANLDRHILIGTIDRDATHREGTPFFDVHLGFLNPLPFKTGFFTTYLYADYMEFFGPNFQESGAQSLNLIVEGKTSDLLRAELGFNWTQSISVGGHFRKSHIIPSVYAGVIQEWRFQGKSTTSGMTGATGTFTVDGLLPNRTLFAPGIELLFACCEWIDLNIGYGAELGRRYQDHHFDIEVNFRY